MNQLQVHTPTTTGTSIALRPAAATRAGNDLVALYRNRLDRSGTYGVPDSIRADRAPSEGERAAMEARRDELVGALTDRPELDPPREDGSSQPLAEKRATFMALLSAFPSFGLTEKGARATAALYCRAVDDLPTWAVKDAASRFLKGRTLTEWSGDRCPTPPKFAEEARRSLDDVHAEIGLIRQVLDAEVYAPVSDAQRQAVLDEIAKAPNSLLVAAKDRPPKPLADAIEEARAAGAEQSRADFEVAAGGGDLSRLMGRLNAKAPRHSAEVGA